MGAFNTIRGSVICTRCADDVEVEAECKLGNTSQMEQLAVGDIYPFGSGDQRSAQSFDADAYAECPSCALDIGLRVRIVEGVVVGLCAEPETLVHLCDATLRSPVTCPSCGAVGEMEIKLYSGRVPTTYRLGDTYERGRQGVRGDSFQERCG